MLLDMAPSPITEVPVLDADIKSRRFGLLSMLAAGVCFSLMNAGVFAISQLDPQLSSVVISFFRIAINLLILLVPALIQGRFNQLLGDRSLSLWLRGVFGSLALMLSFYSISRMGPGESTFLNATSGIFVAFLAPFYLKQSNNFRIWGAIIGSFLGISLMFSPGRMFFDLLGFSAGLSSGFLAALAYLMVAQAGRRNSAQSVVFYFCWVALILHILYFCVYDVKWPDNDDLLLGLLMVGILGSLAQHFMTVAYQYAPASHISAASYFTPVLSMVWGGVFFRQIPDLVGLIGASLILVFGVLLPFLR